MSTYPGTLDSFVAKTDNVDDVMAVDINELQAAIVAVETELGTDPAGGATDLKTRLALAHDNAGHLEFAAPTLLTISGGVVTATQNYHTIDTEGGAGSDNLDTINGGTDGLVLVMRTVSSARDVVVKHNTGNIWCVGGTDFTIDTANQIILAVYDATNSRWHAGRIAGGLDVDGSGGQYYITVWNDANTVTGTDDLQWNGTTLTIGDGTAGIDYAVTINGENADITLTWMEDEGYLSISKDLLLATAEVIYFRDTDIYIHSESDGKLVLTADGSVQINAPTITLQDAGDIALVFDGGSNDGTITWMEDENYFSIADDFLFATTKSIYFRDTAIGINSSQDGYLNLKADQVVAITTPAVNFANAGDITLSFIGTANSRTVEFWDDEDYFLFTADILLGNTRKVYFNDTGTYVNSATDGHLDLTADVSIDINGTLTTTGGRIGKITTYTDTCNILVTDETVILNKATPFTVTLPAAVIGQIFKIKNIGAGIVTLTAPGTDTFDYVDADIMLNQWDARTIQCNDANSWVIL